MVKVLSILLLVPFLASGATTLISTETLIPLSGVEVFQQNMMTMPATNEVVKQNPPTFRWPYTKNPFNNNSDNTPYVFQFQASYFPDFSSLIFDVSTRVPFYNFVDAFVSNEVYWAVAYVTTNGVTNAWSATNVFFIDESAEHFPRASMGDMNYVTNGPASGHPRIYLNQTNLLNLSNLVITANTADWVTRSNAAFTSIGEAFWTDDPYTNDTSGGNLAKIVNVAMVYHLTQNATLLAANPEDTFDRAINYFRSIESDQTDVVSGAVTEGVIHGIGLGYDWIYPMMSSLQRSNALQLIDANLRYILYGGVSFYQPTDTGIDFGAGDPTYEYAGNYYSDRFGEWKFNNSSHPPCLTASAIYEWLAALGDSATANEYYEFGMNLLLSNPYKYGSKYGSRQGRMYNWEIPYRYHLLYGTMAASSVFTTNYLGRIEFWKGLAEWEQFMTPVGFYERNEPFGDTGSNVYIDFGKQNRQGRALAMFTGSETASMHWQQATNFAGYLETDTVFDFLHEYLFEIPATATNQILATNFPSGWAFMHTQPPNTPQAHSNGVSLYLQSRNAGSESGHSHNNDGNYQIVAFGGNITDSGSSGLTQYPTTPWGHYGITADGLGQIQPRFPGNDYQARIKAWTNNSEFTFVNADLVKAYARSNWVGEVAGLNTPSAYLALHDEGPLSDLTQVERNIFMRRLSNGRAYFVFADICGSGSTHEWSIQYHIPQSGLVLSNSTASWNYPVTNLMAQTVTTHVVMANDFAELSITNMTGANAKTNPITGESGYTGNQQTNVLWISTATDATNAYFFYVLYPDPPSSVNPIIDVIDERTFRIRDDSGTDDVVSYDSDNTTADFVIDLATISGVEGLGPVALPPAISRPSFAPFGRRGL